MHGKSSETYSQSIHFKLYALHLKNGYFSHFLKSTKQQRKNNTHKQLTTTTNSRNNWMRQSNCILAGRFYTFYPFHGLCLLKVRSFYQLLSFSDFRMEWIMNGRDEKFRVTSNNAKMCKQPANTRRWKKKTSQKRDK